ncbi:MAG: response regulator transcription factor [Planctomycetota bacterium]|nr:response regulator transcription factor [Planctomycetota bacterium]
MPEPVSQVVPVLIVDDDRKFTALLGDYLRPHGYLVTAVHDGPSGAERAATGQFAAVILDVMLPGADGFEVLRRIRARSGVPVLMLTARGDEADRVLGLEVGADDYVPKTSSARELLARLRAVLRRSAGEPVKPRTEEYTIGELHINVDARTAMIRGAALTLTPVEFELLICLARAGGRVKSRDELLDEIRGRQYEVFDRSVDVHISAIRRKLGDDPKSPRYIRTIRTIGYSLRSPEDGDAA